MFNNIKKYIRIYVWKLLKVKWKLSSGIELKIDNDNDWLIFNEIFTNGEYDKVFEFLNLDKPKPIIVDLGANVGYFTLKVMDYLLQRGIQDFKVYSIEASSNNFFQLKNRMCQKILEGKYKLIHGLIGYKSGSSVLSTQTDHFGYQVTKDAKIGERTDFVDIENILQNDEGRINLLKCDIEGSEEIFLESYPLLLERIDLAVFEFHAGASNIDLCREYLQKAGLKYNITLRTNSHYRTSVEIFRR